MMHAKFLDHRTSGSGEEYFKGFYHILVGHHLCYVTRTIYTNFGSPYRKRLHIQFGFDWPSDFGGFRRRRCLKIVNDDDNGDNNDERRSMGILTWASPI